MRLPVFTGIGKNNLAGCFGDKNNCARYMLNKKKGNAYAINATIGTGSIPDKKLYNRKPSVAVRKSEGKYRAVDMLKVSKKLLLNLLPHCLVELHTKIFALSQIPMINAADVMKNRKMYLLIDSSVKPWC